MNLAAPSFKGVMACARRAHSAMGCAHCGNKTCAMCVVADMHVVSNMRAAANNYVVASVRISASNVAIV